MLTYSSDIYIPHEDFEKSISSNKKVAVWLIYIKTIFSSKMLHYILKNVGNISHSQQAGPDVPVCYASFMPRSFPRLQ